MSNKRLISETKETGNDYCELIIEFEDAADEQIETVKSLGTIKHYFPIINSYIVSIPKRNINELEGLTNVASIFENTHITAQMNNGRRAVKADSVHSKGISGRNITIAFLDTGIAPIRDFTYPRNRIAAFKDFIGNRDSPYDDNGHGSHVAGIAAGNGAMSNGKYCGIAYDANIVSVKILDKEGQGSSALALHGLQWVFDNKDRYDIKIVNLSIGAVEASIRDPLVRAVEALWDSNIVVTVASGNSGPKRNTVTSPGTSKKVITIGAADDNREVQIWGDTLVNFSGRGPTRECIIKPDVIAPGAKIISSLSPNSLLCKDSKKVMNEYYARLSGTSMATPVVSGAIALLLQKHPGLSPDEIKLALKYSSTNMSYPQNHQGWGLLNVEKLLDVEPKEVCIRGGSKYAT